MLKCSKTNYDDALHIKNMRWKRFVFHVGSLDDSFGLPPHSELAIGKTRTRHPESSLRFNCYLTHYTHHSIRSDKQTLLCSCGRCTKSLKHKMKHRKTANGLFYRICRMFERSKKWLMDVILGIDITRHSVFGLLDIPYHNTCGL